MKLTKAKPKVPGWFWFVRAGEADATPQPAKVYYRGGRLCYHVGSWPGMNWADHDSLGKTSPDHLWSDEALLEIS
jgi:hypothetical protein